MLKTKSNGLLVLCFLASMYSLQSVAEQFIDVDSHNWEFRGNGVSREEIDGRKAIKIKTGKAVLNDLMLEDGIVEFDIYLPGERAFSYLYFRTESDAEHEEIYFRSHKSHAPDAVQYSPVFQGRSAWQIYHGNLGTGAAYLPANTWTKVKMELAGSKMILWVGEATEPALVIDQLGRKPRAGTLAFRGFVPRNSAAKYSAYFSQLRVTKSEPLKKELALADPYSDGQITQWRVSPAFEASSGPITELPDLPTASQWSTPVAQPNGSFEFFRSREIPEGIRQWAVAADVNLHSERNQVCELHLGYSDEITLSVNEQVLLYQDASYRYSDRRQEGLMHADQIVAFIPLKKGNNKVRAVVADSFGGWGLIGKLEGCPAVKQR